MRSLSAKARAAGLARKIAAVRRARRFCLAWGSGWINVVRGVGPCGCALGAAHIALGGGVTEFDAAKEGRRLTEAGVATFAEVLQLELGFEQREIRVNTQADIKNPFYKLGHALRRTCKEFGHYAPTCGRAPE